MHVIVRDLVVSRPLFCWVIVSLLEFLVSYKPIRLPFLVCLKMTSTSEDELLPESSQVRHAASMLMEAVQNFVRLPAGRSSASSNQVGTSNGSSVTSNRRRRKRSRTSVSETAERSGLNSGEDEPGSQSSGFVESRLPHQTSSESGQCVNQNYSSRTPYTRRVTQLQTHSGPQSDGESAFQGSSGLQSCGLEPPRQHNSLVCSTSSPHNLSRNRRPFLRQSCSTSASVQQVTPHKQIQRPRDLIVQSSADYQSAGIDEHRKVFRFQPGFQPSKQYTLKGKGSARPLGKES